MLQTTGDMGKYSATCVPDGTASMGKAPPRTASAQMAVFAESASKSVLKVHTCMQSELLRLQGPLSMHHVNALQWCAPIQPNCAPRHADLRHPLEVKHLCAQN